MLTKKQIKIKRAVDIILSAIALLFFGWMIGVLWIVNFLLTKENSFFLQERVGQYGKLFKIVKIRTVYKTQRFKIWASFLRTSKLDELPQLWNVLVGEMSLVGPRPDIQGFADELQGEERVILNLKPGLTGPASLFFLKEEELLAKQKNKEKYNREVIWKKKVQMNLNYIHNYKLKNDIKHMLLTLLRMLTTFRFYK